MPRDAEDNFRKRGIKEMVVVVVVVGGGGGDLPPTYIRKRKFSFSFFWVERD